MNQQANYLAILQEENLTMQQTQIVRELLGLPTVSEAQRLKYICQLNTILVRTYVEMRKLVQPTQEIWQILERVCDRTETATTIAKIRGFDLEPQVFYALVLFFETEKLKQHLHN